MDRALLAAASATAALALAPCVSGQQCYSPQNQCFSFAPPLSEVKRIDTGLNLRSNKLAISGDFRLRARVASTTSGHPYSTSHQETTRARVRLDYDVNEYAHAVVEFNFSEVWAGAEPYSDAFPTQGRTA